jgi:DNA-binding NarL/FixJ family response regulator
MSSIFLVDDHPMLRDGLRHMIAKSPDLRIVGEAATGLEALQRIPQAHPDLVLMDISLPDRSGLELIKDLLAADSSMLILVFSMHDEMLYAERVIRAGARGYLVKGSASEKLLDAIREVVAGRISLSPAVSRHLLSRMTNGRGSEFVMGPARLTDRELEVFQMVGQGLNNNQIAERLHISPRTVDAHRNNIRLKLSLPDTAAVIREAVLWTAQQTMGC